MRALYMFAVVFAHLFSGVATALRLFGIIFGGCCGIFLLAGAICMIVYYIKQNKRERLLAADRYVYADIVDIDVKVNQRVKIDRISMHPYFVTCKYTGANGNTYIFKSRSLFYNPSGLIDQNQLKVYVDLAKPDKYYVDTNSILPDNAMLHKFQYDSDRNAGMLVQRGYYIEAQTCGVEFIGRIKVNGITKSMFLKVSEGMGKQIQIPTDEKNRTYMGYSVLCRYDAPDGRVHIFASKGQWGEPDRAFKGEKVRVYYSGRNFEHYHVALDTIRE